MRPNGCKSPHRNPYLLSVDHDITLDHDRASSASMAATELKRRGFFFDIIYGTRSPKAMALLNNLIPPSGYSTDASTM